MTKASELKCRKCGLSLADGASLKRINAKGVRGIWECRAPCGVPYVSEDAKLLHAIRGDD